ncbi:nucleolar complex protein 4 homolog B isoform X2 [Oratosquilla oratoria]|uniref:nucleolar complex protein 4 homolog B isoform X2 n=1 Tax=Oratosquilla oratoria TaxID=337810 RepID=UPI003F772489
MAHLGQFRETGLVLRKGRRQRLDDKEETLSGAITSLHAIFIFLFQEGDLVQPKIMPEDLLSPSDKYKKWLIERFKETHTQLIILLTHEEKSIQELSIVCLLKLLAAEGKHPISDKSGKKYAFPDQQLKAILKNLISETQDNCSLLTLMLEAMTFADFNYWTLKHLENILKQQKEINAIFMNNFFALLELVDIPEENAPESQQLFLLSDEDAENEEEHYSFTYPTTEAKKHLNSIWQRVIKWNLTPDLYRRSLVLIPDKVLHHMKQPLLFTDFFMESYDLGGPISLLALQGVFILVNKYNLDYPDFYKKLYRLYEPTVFHAKYRARFFMLCDKFLSSSHLPGYLVAAFAKRMSWLALQAPAPCIVMLLHFIVNLLIRYPNLRVLIHNPDVPELENDPFDPMEPDPAKCGASNSSLWEVASLKHHVLPEVAKAAGFIHKNLPIIEHNLGDKVEETYEEMYERACKMKVKTTATTFHKPEGLFKYQDDVMSDMWSLT